MAAGGREFLWYIPNSVDPGHRGNDTVDGWGTLDFSVDLALRAERHGWGGALIGTGWGRPDTFTLATAIAARTTTSTPLVAIRPGYWQPAHFASAAATLDQLTNGRLFINIVSGTDDLAAYGDGEFDKTRRYDRTREFLQVVQRLRRDEDVTFRGEFFDVEHSTLAHRPDLHSRKPSVAVGQQRLLDLAAAKCSTPASTPERAATAAGAPEPPGWWVQRLMCPLHCNDMPIWVSLILCSPIPRTKPKSAE